MKNNKLLTKVLIILIIIAVTLIAFVGIYVKDKNTKLKWKNYEE